MQATSYSITIRLLNRVGSGPQSETVIVNAPPGVFRDESEVPTKIGTRFISPPVTVTIKRMNSIFKYLLSIFHLQLARQYKRAIFELVIIYLITFQMKNVNYFV